MSGIIADNVRSICQPSFTNPLILLPIKNPFTPHLFLFVLARVSQIWVVMGEIKHRLIMKQLIDGIWLFPYNWKAEFNEIVWYPYVFHLFGSPWLLMTLHHSYINFFEDWWNWNSPTEQYYRCTAKILISPLQNRRSLECTISQHNF